jgi:DNA invertase Pin-like site-specific DNA recombinase
MYYRVSTDKQGRSGLGLEAQQAAAEQYVGAQGWNILTSYTEVETGKRKDRPELLKALAHARRAKAILVVAKLDRLARNVAFTSALMESGAEFVAVDNPHATKFTIHILAAVAEHEAEMISQRTKAALAALKARGVKLGSARPGHWDGREHLRAAGGRKAQPLASAANSARAREAYQDLQSFIRERRDAGDSLRQIAEALNQQGQTTRNGRPWNQVQVMRVLKF